MTESLALLTLIVIGFLLAAGSFRTAWDFIDTALEIARDK